MHRTATTWTSANSGRFRPGAVAFVFHDVQILARETYDIDKRYRSDNVLDEVTGGTADLIEDSRRGA